jgi:cell division transport system permease protein
VQDKTSLWQRFSYTPYGHAIRHSLHYLISAKVATFITLLVLAISLALPAIFGLFVDNLRHVNLSRNDANSLTIYLKNTVDDLRGVELADEIQQRDEFQFTHYISRDEALETFNKNFTLADATESLDNNPLPGAIVAVMSADDDDDFRIKQLVNTIEQIAEVDLVKYDLQWLKRLNSILSLVSRAIILIGSLLVITTLLVIGNTIRLEMMRRADEIAVSQLIGASHHQIRRPFIYSGFIYGFLGGLLACLLVNLVIFSLQGPVKELSGLYSSSFSLQGLSLVQTLLMLCFSSLIGIIGAWLAVHWQISKIMTQQS